MDFSDNKVEIKTIATKEFFSNIRDLIFDLIHHSQASGYAHDFCNKIIGLVTRMIFLTKNKGEPDPHPCICP